MWQEKEEKKDIGQIDNVDGLGRRLVLLAS